MVFDARLGFVIPRRALENSDVNLLLGSKTFSFAIPWIVNSSSVRNFSLFESYDSLFGVGTIGV